MGEAESGSAESDAESQPEVAAAADHFRLFIGRIRELQETLGYTFRDAPAAPCPDPPIRFRKSNPAEDNQRMEFLGDAILQAVISTRCTRFIPTATRAR